MHCSSLVDVSHSKIVLEAATQKNISVLSSARLPQSPGLLDKNLPQKVACKRAARAHSVGRVHEMEHWFNRKSFICSFPSF